MSPRYFVVIAVSAAVRVLMLLYAVRGGDVLVRRLVGGGSLFFEAAVFAVVLRMSGELRVRDGLGGMVRTFLASIITMAAVWATGWGWHDAASTRVLPAIVEGAGIGLFVIAVFAAALSTIWWLAGAPEGPETRLAAMLRPLFSRLKRLRVA